jgi:hypothetical protein
MLRIPKYKKPRSQAQINAWAKYQEIKARHHRMATEWMALLADITDIDTGLESWLYGEWPICLIRRRRIKIDYNQAKIRT